MGMIRSLGTADMTALGALTGVALGETPFFPGGNAILHLSQPIGAAGVISVQGAPTVATPTGQWTTLRTINAAAGDTIEIVDLPKAIRINRTTVGTGSIVCTLEGVQ